MQSRWQSQDLTPFFPIWPSFNSIMWQLPRLRLRHWSTASLQISAHATSPGSLTHLEKSAICSLPHTRAHRHFWLASNTMTDRKQSIPSVLENMTNFCYIGYGITGIYITFSSQYVSSYIPDPRPKTLTLTLDLRFCVCHQKRLCSNAYQ